MTPKNTDTQDKTDKQAQPPMPPPYPMYYYPPEEEINLYEYWKILVEHKKLIGIITGASTLLALIIALVMAPIYRAETLLAPVSEDQASGLSALAGQFGGLAELAGVNLGSSKNKTGEYIAALKSRSLSVEFINKYKLKPILFPRQWDEDAKQWEDKDEVPSDWKAFEKWDKDIRRVSVNKRNGLATLAIEWEDAKQAAIWANELTKHVNSRLRTKAVEEADRSIAYLEKQLPQTNSVEVQQSIYKLIEAQTKKKMIASTREEYAFTTIDPAVVPERKHRPRRLMLVIVGLLLGLIGSIAITLIKRNQADIDKEIPQDRGAERSK